MINMIDSPVKLLLKGRHFPSPDTLYLHSNCRVTFFHISVMPVLFLHLTSRIPIVDSLLQFFLSISFSKPPGTDSTFSPVRFYRQIFLISCDLIFNIFQRLQKTAIVMASLQSFINIIPDNVIGRIRFLPLLFLGFPVSIIFSFAITVRIIL